MKRAILTSLVVVMMAAMVGTAQAGLVVHWKLDEANGDYTGGGIMEEVYGNSTVATEVSTGTSVTEGLTGMAPDGGTSMGFTDTPSDSYIAAGSIEDNAGSPGAYIAGAATSPYVLGNNFSITGWFNTDTLGGGDKIMFSNQFGSGSGILFGLTGGNILMDFGNNRAQYAAGVVTGQDYFLVVRQDPNGDSNLGWDANANHRMSLYDPSTDTWQHFDGQTSKSGLNLQNMSIGRFTNGGREFQGKIDDIRVYDETLTQADLDALVIPEPASLALLGIGGLMMIRRRK